MRFSRAVMLDRENGEKEDDGGEQNGGVDEEG